MNSSDQNQVVHANEWLNDHGQKSFEELKELAETGTPESLERLHRLADDNNISYDDSTEPMELVQQISQAVKTDPNAGVE